MGPYCCKRRDILVTHLIKNHRVHDQGQGRSIADNGKCSSGKRFWSCGFCVCVFDNFDDRLTHILSHIESQEAYGDWCATNIMKGLLLQPDVSDAWEEVMASRHFWVRPEVEWEHGNVNEVRPMLEEGPSSSHDAKSLADLAYAAGKENWSAVDAGSLARMPDLEGHTSSCSSASGMGALLATAFPDWDSYFAPSPHYFEDFFGGENS